MTSGNGDFVWRSELDELRRVTQLVLNQVSHWTPARWGDRGDELHGLLQRIAGPEHTLPRLPDIVLPDQLRVLVADLIEKANRQADSRVEVGRAVEGLKAFRSRLTSAQ
jgi:hypothetical protein